MTTIHHQEFDANAFFNNVLYHGLLELLLPIDPPAQGYVQDALISTGVVSKPAEGAVITDSDFAVTVEEVTPRLFGDTGNATEMALLMPGLNTAINESLTIALKAAVEKEVADELWVANKTFDSEGAETSDGITYSTTLWATIEKWVENGNLLNRLQILADTTLIASQHLAPTGRNNETLFEFYGIPIIYNSDLLGTNFGLLFDPKQVVLVPYQEPTITAASQANPTQVVFTGRCAYGIHVRNPNSVYGFSTVPKAS